MAAQKRKKKLVTEIFGFFEHLLTRNPTNQDSELLDSSRPYERLLENISKRWGTEELFLPENDFKTCSSVNSTKRLKNWILWFLELYLYLKYISNKDNIWYREALPGALLEERKLNIKKSKNIVAGSIKGFLIIC